MNNRNKNDIICIQNMSKQFQNRTIFDGVNLTISESSFVILTGKSGIGKTTLLNILRHDEVPDIGEIYVSNYQLSKLSTKDIPYLRRNIGCVFQRSNLIPNMTVKENLVYPLEALGKDDSLIKQRYSDVLNLVGLYHMAQQRASELSGGEQQMVSLARAMICMPCVLLADEPTGNLDAENRDKILNILRKIAGAGTTVLMVTHDEEVIKSKKYDRILTIENNKIIDKTIDGE